MLPRCVAIIPARYASSRFPGKPLADILGRPMFWHVYQRALECSSIREAYLATDHERIYRSAVDLDVPVFMTSKAHESGTDRIMEAARKMDLDPECIVVNIQGDEPALEPGMLDQLLVPFVSASQANITTLVRSIDSATAENPDVVKVVISETGRALYFSRSLIPYSQDRQGSFLGHIGLYAYRMEYLKKFSSLGPSPLEKSEKLEQLRFLEADIPIHVVQTEHVSHGVDRPEDISRIVKMLKERRK